ncbi:MAG: hypothetical protein V4686_02245 [Patescibacteria group bacterium]
MKEFILRYLWLMVAVLSVLVTIWLDPTMIRYHRNTIKLLRTRAPNFLRKVWGLKEILDYTGEITEGRVQEMKLKIKQHVEELAVVQGKVEGRVCGEAITAKLLYPNRLSIQVRNPKTKKAVEDAYRAMMKRQARARVKLYPLVLDIQVV